MLISFEGIDGSGKSTQLALLRDRLQSSGYTVHTYREPGGTVVSETIRSLLLNPDITIDPVTELLLFSSARSQLIVEKVLPDLEKGVVVLLDRFYDSTIAYQGYGRKSLPVEDIHRLNKTAAHGLEPDLTIYLHVPLDQAYRRREGTGNDRMEGAGTEFYERVVRGFEDLAAAEERFVKIDAVGDINSVAQKIKEHVERKLMKVTGDQ